MKKLSLNFTLIITTLFFTSCGSYVAKVHRDLDRDIAQREGLIPQDEFDQYRRPEKITPPSSRVRPENGHQTYSPRVKRHYRTAPDGQERSPDRVTASDLIDKEPSQSLWVKNNESLDLFTDNSTIKHGDIVLVSVFKKLKNEITLELKRAFPTPPSKKPDNADGGEGDESQRGPADEEMAKDGSKVYDRISTVVVEEVNKDHVLLRGRKNLIYKNQKRLVEVQALVARRDLSDTDTVDSNNIIESSISVLR
jgi:flagellar basal body L-ring protein FlgH